MICIVCKSGRTNPGTVTDSFRKGETLVVVKDIPADVCTQCGEPYIDGEVARALERLVDDAVRKGTEVQILRYAA